MSEKKKYRAWTVGQKLEIVLAGLRGDRSVAGLPRASDFRSAVLRLARQAAGGRRGAPVREGGAHRARRAAQARPGAGADPRPQDLRVGDPGKRIPDVGVTKRVAYARQLVAEGHSPSALARILKISRQGIYRVRRPPGRRTPPNARRPARSSGRSSRSLTLIRPTATGSSPPGCSASWGGR